MQLITGIKIDKIKLPNTKIKLLQKLLAKAIDEFKKTNRIKAVDFSKRLKKLIEVYNERKDFDIFQSHVLDDVAEQFSNLFKDLQKERMSLSSLVSPELESKMTTSSLVIMPKSP